MTKFDSENEAVVRTAYIVAPSCGSRNNPASVHPTASNRILRFVPHWFWNSRDHKWYVFSL